MLLLRDVVLACDPALASTPAFGYYWLALALVGLGSACVAARHLPQLGMLLATVLLGVTAAPCRPPRRPALALPPRRAL